ncbi:MAG: hypothetical protein ACI8T1_000206 [Verrucomicrobiales bacterium]|jgi:hypothetical protein
MPKRRPERIGAEDHFLKVREAVVVWISTRVAEFTETVTNVPMILLPQFISRDPALKTKAELKDRIVHQSIGSDEDTLTFRHVERPRWSRVKQLYRLSFPKQFQIDVILFVNTSQA